MLENTSMEPTPQSTAVPPTEASNVSQGTSHAINLCAVGLICCFFLPWMRILFVELSGLHFTKEGGRFLLFWSLPIFSGLTILAGFAKTNQKAVAQFAGAIPFFILSFALYNGGKEVMQGLAIGAYGALALGLMIFILAGRLK